MARRMAPGRGAGGPGRDQDPLSGLRRLQDEMAGAPSSDRIGSSRPRRGDDQRADRPVAGRRAATALDPGEPRPPGGPGPAGRKPKIKRSLGQRVLRGGVLVLAVLLVAAGAGYGYVQWKLDQIRSVACPSCVAAPSGPYNVLIVGSDSRAGDTGAAAQAFGTSAEVAGARSDTIKIVHVDPAAHTARLLSIPRDTFVQLSDIPASTGLSTDNKINAAFNNGADPLIKTIENTFGIPISHFVTIDFSGVIDLVNAVGGINLDFPYPARDDDAGNNNSGLMITHAGCQTLNGTMALALSRSRYYQYYADGSWQADPTSDLGRIQRQNTIIEAVIDKAKGDLNPFSLNDLLDAVVHDITKDDNLSGTGLVSLVQNYHAFQGSDLQTYTLPTTSASYEGESVQVVEPQAADQVISAFLGGSPGPVATPPLDAYGYPQSAATASAASTPSSPSGSTAGTGSGSGSGSGSAPASPPTTLQPPPPDFDPTVC